MNRRNFLLNSGVSIGAGALLPVSRIGERLTDIPGENTVPVSFDSWADIRKQFLLAPDRIHMSQMLLAAHPKTVRDAIEMHRKAFDLNPVEHWESHFIAIEDEMRTAAATYVEAESAEIALTDSTTMGLALLYSGFKFKPGDEILTTTHDHYSTEKALDFAAAKSGATIKRIPLYTDPSATNVDEMVTALKKNISPRTRVVAITFVHSCTGVKTPIKAIAHMIRQVNGSRSDVNRIYLCVDGVHGFGIENITMPDLGCDFFVAGTHKWIFGPRGTGIFFARRDAWKMVAPIIPSFQYATYGAWLDLFPAEQLTFADLCTPGGFHSFEHRYGLKEAFAFQLNIGKARVEERTHQLSTLLKEGLAGIKHIRLITPMSTTLSAGINCFEVEGIHPDEVVKKLLEKNIIASASPYKTSYVRLTPSIVNTEEEVNTCLRVLELMKEQ